MINTGNQIHLRIEGRVQGVCFRMYTQRRAQQLGVTGWVRNLSDGAVEVVASGPETALRRLEEWCRQGPPAAEVTNLECTRLQATKEYKSFSIR